MYAHTLHSKATMIASSPPASGSLTHIVSFSDLTMSAQKSTVTAPHRPLNARFCSQHWYRLQPCYSFSTLYIVLLLHFYLAFSPGSNRLALAVEQMDGPGTEAVEVVVEAPEEEALPLHTPLNRPRVPAGVLAFGLELWLER